MYTDVTGFTKNAFCRGHWSKNNLESEVVLYKAVLKGASSKNRFALGIA